MMTFRKIITLLNLMPLLIFSPHLQSAVDGEKLMGEVINKGVNINLRHPTYSDGVLTTEKGGVIEGPGLRIQASKIIYTSKKIDGKQIQTIEAEDNVILEFNDYYFIGEKLEYNFLDRTGMVYNGKTKVGPWFIGGDQIRLLADGTYKIRHAFLTTSENEHPEWQITSKEATLQNNEFLTAKEIKLYILKMPLFYLPLFKANLNSIFDTPFQYDIRWGGKNRTLLSVIYEVFSWERLKVFTRVDYRLDRGPGAGVETYYRSDDGKERFETINFIARDTSQDYPNQRLRYRVQGMYTNSWEKGRTSADLSYDWLSDKDMATDYDDRGLELDVAGRTQLHLRRQERQQWIGNFFTRVRVNDFQSMKQELPTLETNIKPFTLGSTGIISENQLKVSYLDYVYSKHLRNVHNFHSSRTEFSHHLYRPLKNRYFALTPEAGITAIFYENTPQRRSRWLTFGNFNCELNTNFYKFRGKYKHVITPYLKYEYLTFPTASPNQHFIFDINDGWYRLNTLRFGINQNFYFKNRQANIVRYFSADLFSYAFFHTRTIPSNIPKVYGQFTWYVFPTLRYTLDTAWDFWHNQLDHFNFHTEWTISDNLAINTEFRHRDAYDWRKVDKLNFILDSFRSVNELLHSSLSDRRNTLLFHIFYRFDPKWALEFESRHGWNRRHEKNYNEFEFDLLTTIRSTLNVKIVYQHKENERTDKRLAVYFSVGINPPDKKSCEKIIPMLDF